MKYDELSPEEKELLKLSKKLSSEDIKKFTEVIQYAIENDCTIETAIEAVTGKESAVSFKRFKSNAPAKA